VSCFKFEHVINQCSTWWATNDPTWKKLVISGKATTQFVHSSVLVNTCSYIEQEPKGNPLYHPIGNGLHKFLNIMRRFVHTPTTCHGSTVDLPSSGGVQRDRIRNSLDVHENGFYVSCEKQIPSVQDCQIDRSPNVSALNPLRSI